LTESNFGARCAIQNIGPVLGREDLINPQKSIEELSKIQGSVFTEITPEELHRNKRSNIVDHDEE
jgi:hypothetical protein